ncbi:MAG TPA: hypothetical protein VFO01_09395 [Trebonia sp.]|nr:hypothetical protein [Trebonia sp.]
MTVQTGRTGWPVVRTPKWMWGGGALLVGGLVLAAIPHHPSASQRATDLQNVVSSMTTGIESCAGGINDSMTALRAIQAGTSHNVSTAVKIANDGAANCSPANSMPMDDLVQYQVPESLATFNLQSTINDLVTWGFPLAQNVQLDIGKLDAATTPAEKAAATATLHKDQQVLDAQRAKIDNAIKAADTALSANVAPPNLPS